MKPRKKSSKSGKCQIVINMEAPEECRIGLLENGRLEAFDIETFSHTQTRGNLYKGRILKIEPSLHAAFVDIGLPRNGYLPLADIHPEYYGYAENKKRIHEFLKKDQDILVQIVKEETHIKGSAITTYLSIPARYLVLMPGTAQVGVSRKIEDEEERQRLKQILKACKLPEGVGLIARTVAEGVPKVEIQKDLRYLARLWSNLRKKAQSAQAPALIYRDRDLVKRFLRNYLTSDVKEILVDRQEIYDNIKAFLRIIAPRQVATVRLYQGDVPIFSHFDIETLIEQVYQPNVSLPSGAHIVIEPTEALVSIDVNSGKNVRGKNIEETALKTNLEAAEEIARQLRLRDLGGIIVIDFIDMRNRTYRQQVEKRMRKCLKKDRARTETARISRFGVLELVRQKIRSPVQLGSYCSCPYCHGRGVVMSVEALALADLRRISAHLASSHEKKSRQLVLEAPDQVVSYLLNRKRLELYNLEKNFDVEIRVETNPNLGLEEHKLYSKTAGTS
ncbi:MAG: Rne/Rng family ribonuclease [Thermodesulfobacteriota bacterium]|nr:Rne/Rng family ribonuclease [Thermodesulfobacteriota bacterium]